MKRPLLAVTSALVFVACGPPPAPKFSELQTKVFAPSCNFSTCHVAAGGGAGGLKLEATVSYQQLVNSPATGTAGRTRVVPGDLKLSYLIEKLTSATPAAGVRMPQGGDPLEAERLDLIKAWIVAGAKND